jgi:hypothetical protein
MKNEYIDFFVVTNDGLKKIEESEAMRTIIDRKQS